MQNGTLTRADHVAARSDSRPVAAWQVHLLRVPMTHARDAG